MLSHPFIEDGECLFSILSPDKPIHDMLPAHYSVQEVYPVIKDGGKDMRLGIWHRLIGSALKCRVVFLSHQRAAPSSYMNSAGWIGRSRDGKPS